MSLQDGEDMILIEYRYHKYVALEVLQSGDGPTAPSIRNNQRSLNMFRQAGTATSAPAILSFCLAMIPGSYTLLYYVLGTLLSPTWQMSMINDKYKLKQVGCHSIYKHSSAHQGPPPQGAWFHTCITTEAGPSEAAWTQQIIFQPIQDHGLRRIMGCPLSAD